MDGRSIASLAAMRISMRSPVKVPVSEQFRYQLQHCPDIGDFRDTSVAAWWSSTPTDDTTGARRRMTISKLTTPVSERSGMAGEFAANHV